MANTPDCKTVNMTTARQEFPQLFNEVVYGGKLVIIQKYKQRVAMVPVGFIDRLHELEGIAEELLKPSAHN